MMKTQVRKLENIYETIIDFSKFDGGNPKKKKSLLIDGLQGFPNLI